MKQSYQSLDHFLHQMHLKGIDGKRLDERFQNELDRKDTELLARASRVLITLWELTRIIMKSPPGTQIVIDADSGYMYRGRISQEKLLTKFKQLPVKVAGRKSLIIDGNGANERIVAKVGFVPFRNHHGKRAYDVHAKALAKVEANEDVFWFEEKMKEVAPEDVTESIVKFEGHEFLEISIKDYPTKIRIMNSSGRLSHSITEGKITYFR